jgi:hypothetical protein
MSTRCPTSRCRLTGPAQALVARRFEGPAPQLNVTNVGPTCVAGARLFTGG